LPWHLADEQHVIQQFEIVRKEESSTSPAGHLAVPEQALDLAFMAFAAGEAAEALGDEAELEGLFALPIA
jgi:hypothetical protein